MPESGSSRLDKDFFTKHKSSLEWWTVPTSWSGLSNTSYFHLTIESYLFYLSILTNYLETLGLRKNFSPVYILHRIFLGKCPLELFEIMPSSRFNHRSARHWSKVHLSYLEPLPSSTVHWYFLPCTVRLSNYISSSAFPEYYDMSSSNEICGEYSMVSSGLAVPLTLLTSISDGNHLTLYGS